MKKVKKTKIASKKVTSSKKPEGTGLDFGSVENQLEILITKNLPALPDNVIETLVKIAPWLAVLGTVMGVPALLTVLKLNRFMAYYHIPGMGWGWELQASNLLLVVQMILTALSIQGLFARQLSAWRLMYYAAWVSLFSTLLSSGLVSMVISGLISFYILFQVKESYKS